MSIHLWPQCIHLLIATSTTMVTSQLCKKDHFAFSCTAVVKIRRLFFSRFCRACLISLHLTGTMCLKPPRFVSGSALLRFCYAPCETAESFICCSDLSSYTTLAVFTTCCVSPGSNHWNAKGGGGSEIHSCAGARSSMGQCKFSLPE